jgi:hypothetical protein
MKQVFTYNGNDIFGELNFGLYGWEDIDFIESKKEILHNFSYQYKDKIAETLAKYGMKFKKLKWFSPRQYNFMTDSIDLELKVVDKKRLIQAVIDKQEDILAKLRENKSYDGYMALTASSIEEVIDDINEGKGLDTIALRVLLGDIDFSDFRIEDYIVFEAVDDIVESAVDYIGLTK